MESILPELINAGLVGGLNGDDTRLVKMQQAAQCLAEEFKAQPTMLIQAILTALDPDVAGTDQTICKAEDAVKAEWPSMRSIHVDQPISLLRAILFDACQLASESVNGAILWMTAIDTLPYARLGKEEAVVQRILQGFATVMESVAQDAIGENAPSGKYDPILIENTVGAYEVDREDFTENITASLNVNTTIQVLNGYSANLSTWAAPASKALATVLADLIDDVAVNIATNQENITQEVLGQLGEIKASTQNIIETSLNSVTPMKSQLDTLWWSEALYSPTLRKSYRELPPQLGAIVMAIDLLGIFNTVTPVATAYVLAEAVARLPQASYENRQPLSEILTSLPALGKQLPSDWLTPLTPPPKEGRISLRDAAVTALRGENDANKLLKRAVIPSDTMLSLPEFSRAIFRQEQAIRLAMRAEA